MALVILATLTAVVLAHPDPLVGELGYVRWLQRRGEPVATAAEIVARHHRHRGIGRPGGPRSGLVDPAVRRSRGACAPDRAGGDARGATGVQGIGRSPATEHHPGRGAGRILQQELPVRALAQHDHDLGSGRRVGLEAATPDARRGQRASRSWRPASPALSRVSIGRRMRSPARSPG